MQSVTSPMNKHSNAKMYNYDNLKIENMNNDVINIQVSSNAKL